MNQPDTFLQYFSNTVALYTNDDLVLRKYTEEIVQHYTTAGRHYHNLQHLNNLTDQLLQVKDKICNWSTVIFSIAYHDIIYNTHKDDNEEQSAAFAVKRLHAIQVPDQQVAGCRQQILATKGHAVSEDADTNYFTDADLSVLGADPETYRQYAAQIRQEYKHYPNLVYKTGRKKVLQHFLKMGRIFKTDHFSGKYEQRARMNMQDELAEL